MDSNITFYCEDGRGNIFDDKGNEATAYNEVPSFRLKKITDLKKLVKNNTYSELHQIGQPDVEMREAAVKKEGLMSVIYILKKTVCCIFISFSKKA